MRNKYFVSIIWGYFEHFYELAPEENYHLHILKVAKELGFSPVVIIRRSKYLIENDPNFDKDIKVIEYVNNWQFFIEVFKLVFKNSVFYVNSYEWQSFVIPFLSRRTIFMAHTQPKRQTILKQKIQNFVYKFFSFIRLNNEDEKEYLISEGVSLKKLFVVPLVVSTEVFKLKTEVNERKNLVYFGNITEKKNLLTIIKAFEVVKLKKPDLKLNIIGNLWDKKVKEYASKSLFNIDILFLGFMPNDTLVLKLNENAVYLNSSFDEGQCVAVYDAALCGCSLCLPNIMSFRGVFKDKALFHEVCDYEQLSKNIIKYLDDVNLVTHHREACLKMIKDNYNKEIVEKKIAELILKFK